MEMVHYYFSPHEMMRVREVSRWHLDVQEPAMWLFWFREELVVELRTKADSYRRRAALCEARALQVSGLIPASMWSLGALRAPPPTRTPTHAFMPPIPLQDLAGNTMHLKAVGLAMLIAMSLVECPVGVPSGHVK